MNALILTVLSALALSGCVTIPVTVSDNLGPVTITTDILKSNDILAPQ